MREYIYSLMTDKRDGFIAFIIKGFLSLVSFFYGLVLKIMRPIRIFTAKKLPCKVISVGNLTLGGTGKTPTACLLARFLKKEGRNPTVLIRGYGDDEWKMLESLLDNIPVIVGRDRVSSGRKACSKFQADPVILDDGFQHWRLKRDLDILLVDSTNPFGNRRLFPRGVLREDIKDLGRADIVMLTKTDMASSKLKDVKNELRDRVPHIPILESIHAPLEFYNLTDKKKLEVSFIKDANICSLSSIVNTEYFEYVLKALGADIVSRFHYPDHYNYKQRDLEFITNQCKKLNIDTIVTTEKDAVKLNQIQETRPRMRILVLRIELKVTDGERILKERLRSLYSV